MTELKSTKQPRRQSNPQLLASFVFSTSDVHKVELVGYVNILML